MTALWPGFWRQRDYNQRGSEYFYKGRRLRFSWRVYVSGWSPGFSIQERFNFLMVHTANLEENIYWVQGTCLNEKNSLFLYGSGQKKLWGLGMEITILMRNIFLCKLLRLSFLIFVVWIWLWISCLLYSSGLFFNLVLKVTLKKNLKASIYLLTLFLDIQKAAYI